MNTLNFTLDFGDKKSGILTIQQSQSDPQKALAEIVENSIDAKAKTINIIRRRRKGEIELTILDDGIGVKPGKDGNPDFDRLGKSICDSFKKHLDQFERRSIQGEFGIGLLGFAAIGNNLEMTSSTGSSKTMFFRLQARSIKYDSGVALSSLEHSGTLVRIWPVHKDIQARLTAEKLNSYLGQELRERIRKSQVNIIITDKLARGKQVFVKPQDYKGSKIREIEKIKTPSGNILFRLFIAQEKESGNVSLYRRGTRVIDDICSIPELDHSPWNNEMLEGMIDSRFITISPASRRGVVPDTKLTELIDAAKTVEKNVEKVLDNAKKQREEKLGRDIIKELQDIFADAMSELDEYNWFGSKRIGPIPGGGPIKTRPPKRVPIATGPLDYVTIVPKLAQVIPNESKKFVAKAWTSNNALIPTGVHFSWEFKPATGSLRKEDEGIAIYTAPNEEGEVTLTVKASKEGKQAFAQAEVLILSKKKKSTGLSLPYPIGVDKPGEPWRSRWLETTNEMHYNIGHPNYKAAKDRGKKARFRYLAFLYAKHLVMHNYSKSGEESVLERMIEVIATLETRM